MQNGPSSFPPGGIAVVFGSSGGIGGAFMGLLDADTRFAHAVGFSRGGVPSIALEDEASLARAASIAAELGELRLVIDATGFLHDGAQRADKAEGAGKAEGADKANEPDKTRVPEKSWTQMSVQGLARSFAINAIGPALIMKHVLPLLPREGKSVFATLSARVGSIGDNRLGGWYGYRASKAALNQMVRTAAIELKRKNPEAVCVALHPGTVDTALSRPFQRKGVELQPPELAAKRLLAVVGALGPNQTGCFFDYKGETVAW